MYLTYDTGEPVELFDWYQPWPFKLNVDFSPEGTLSGKKKFYETDKPSRWANQPENVDMRLRRDYMLEALNENTSVVLTGSRRRRLIEDDKKDSDKPKTLRELARREALRLAVIEFLKRGYELTASEKEVAGAEIGEIDFADPGSGDLEPGHPLTANPANFDLAAGNAGIGDAGGDTIESQPGNDQSAKVRRYSVGPNGLFEVGDDEAGEK